MIFSISGLLVPLLALAPATAGSDTLGLELSQAILLALDESHSSQVLDLSLAGAEHDVAAAKGRFRTYADAQFALPDLQEGVQRVQVPGYLPRYDSYGRREMSAKL